MSTKKETKRLSERTTERNTKGGRQGTERRLNADTAIIYITAVR